MYCITPTITNMAKILLQTSPHSLKAALNKCLREASTIDGVLECHDEHFWPIGQSVSLIVGTLKVRVTKNANEQVILMAVNKIFAPLLSHLTVQVEKDDWNIRTTTPSVSEPEQDQSLKSVVINIEKLE